MTRRRLRPGRSLGNGWPRSTRRYSGYDERFLLDDNAARGFRIERAGGTAGYAYISAEGHVGPLAIAPDADAKAVVTMAVRCALESAPNLVSMIVPGRADGVMQAVLEIGFRIEEPYVLMASRPFGNWGNYLPRAPGFL